MMGVIGAEYMLLSQQLSKTSLKIANMRLTKRLPRRMRTPSPTPLGLLDRGDADGFEEEAEFYRAKVQTSAFVFERLLPRTAAHRAAILAPTSALTAMRNEDFSFDHGR